MSGIKDKKWKNDIDELSEHSQKAEIVLHQESNVTLQKLIQSETRNNNEKTFNHEFSENNTVNSITFVEKKRARNKNLKIRRKY